MKRILFSLLFALFLLPTAAYAQNDTKLVLSTSATELTPYEPFTVQISVHDSPDVYGIETHLRFDPAMLEVIDVDTDVAGVQVTGGFFIDPTDDLVFTLQNQADNEAGTLDYALALVAPAPAVQGSGELMTVTFRPKTDGRTTIEVTDSQLVSPNVTEIPHTVETLNLAVGDVSILTNPMLPFVLLGIGLLLIILLLVLLFFLFRRRVEEEKKLAKRNKERLQFSIVDNINT